MSSKTEWVQVGELADGFAADSNVLEYVDDLAGKSIDLYLDNGEVIRHKFDSGEQLTWKIIEGNQAGSSSRETYTATSIREGVYFIDFIKTHERATSVSIVLNFNSGHATIVLAQMPTEAETMRPLFQRVQDGDLLTPVSGTFFQCAIDRPYSPDSGHSATEELVGKRVQYEYSPHEYYEHIYLNKRYYTWQCLKGVEVGLAETDLCDYFKIDDNLYLFVWREKVIPTLGVIMIDLERLKTTGKILGYDGANFGQLNNFPVGAFAKVLNETRYELS